MQISMRLTGSPHPFSTGFDLGVNKQLMVELSGLHLGPPRLPVTPCPLPHALEIAQKYLTIFPWTPILSPRLLWTWLLLCFIMNWVNNTNYTLLYCNVVLDAVCFSVDYSKSITVPITLRSMKMHICIFILTCMKTFLKSFLKLLRCKSKSVIESTLWWKMELYMRYNAQFLIWHFQTWWLISN